jgi:hypothetical protein
MKKLLIITGIVVVILLIAAYFAYKPFMKWSLRNNINKVAIEYVTDVLLIQDFDSIKIIKIDSISDLAYAKLTLELLEEMKVNYDYLYQDALMNGESEESSDQILAQSKEVEIALSEYYSISNNDQTNTKNLRNYLVYATYFRQGLATHFLFLTTPKGEYYELNPFKE